MKKYISYYRVSTKRQGKSGLGLEAQKRAVNNFLRSEDELLKEYKEVESGSNNERPELMKAIKFSNENQVTLLIAKLDRLSRNVSFIYMLQDSKVDFVCCDLPDANSLTIGIMAVLAQDERERISHRTKVTLAELKAKGVKLGSPQNLTEDARQKGVRSRKQNALKNENNKKATALIVSMKKEGKSYKFIANALNEYGFVTRYKKSFSSMTVKRLFDRFKLNEKEII